MLVTRVFEKGRCANCGFVESLFSTGNIINGESVSRGTRPVLKVSHYEDANWSLISSSSPISPSSSSESISSPSVSSNSPSECFRFLPTEGFCAGVVG